MSVVTSVTVTPNRLEILYRYLRARGTMSVGDLELKKILAPPSLQTGDGVSSIANEVLREAARMGLVQIADGQCRLAVSVDDADSLLAWMEAHILDPAWAEKAGQSELPLAVAWMLEQDPTDSFDFSDNVSRTVTSQCGPDVNAFGMINFDRSQNMVYWARYLGYAWRLSVGSRTMVVPDPTVALSRHLPRLLARPGESTVAGLLQAWAQPCPVLEAGAARERVMDCWVGSGRRDALTLSRSTSLALLRLERRGVIKLERRSDAPAYTLSTRPNPMPVSHVVLRQDE